MATVLEPTIDRGPAPESSDRSFGFVFAVVFCIIGCWPLVLRLGAGARSHVPKMPVRGGCGRPVAACDEPVGPLTLSFLPSANSMLSKKHM